MHQHALQPAHQSMYPSFSKPTTSPSTALATSGRWTSERLPAPSLPITQALTHIVYPLVLSESPPVCHPQHKVTFGPPVHPSASTSGTCQSSDPPASENLMVHILCGHLQHHHHHYIISRMLFLYWRRGWVPKGGTKALVSEPHSCPHKREPPIW